MADENFIHEVDENVRVDQALSLLKRSLPIIIGVVIAVIVVTGGVWAYMSWHAKAIDKASENYDAAYKDLVAGNRDKAFTEFAEVAKGPSRAYKTLALMQQGGILIDQHRTADAVQKFDAAAAAAPNLILGDEARLKSAFAILDTASLGALESRLKPLTDEKHPYRIAAREALAMARLRAGKLKEARSDFNILLITPDTPETVRRRASAAIAIIDSGTAATLPQIIQEQAKLPPMTAMPSNAIPATPQPGAAQ